MNDKVLFEGLTEEQIKEIKKERTKFTLGYLGGAIGGALLIPFAIFGLPGSLIGLKPARDLFTQTAVAKINIKNQFDMYA